MCSDWAAVHKDNDSGIWEAANLRGTVPAKGSDRRLRVACGLAVWLASRAPALRQLQFPDMQKVIDDEDNAEGAKVRLGIRAVLILHQACCCMPDHLPGARTLQCTRSGLLTKLEH